MIWKIPRCYDSHLHLLGTGMIEAGLKLFHLSSADDVKNIKTQAAHFRGEWLVGFGWDQNCWQNTQFPTKEMIDHVFPDFPVAFTRADGHAVWLNSCALEKIGYLNKTAKEKPDIDGGIILRDEQDHPTGVFIDLAKIYVDQFIPRPTVAQNRYFLEVAHQYFHQRGFTHIRDMSGNIKLWQLLQEREDRQDLKLYIEENFTCENIGDFERALKEALLAKKTESQHLRVYGIKFYFDGALGSQGAFLSEPYVGTDQRGLTLWPLNDVREAIKRTWQAGLAVSVHTIGDEAAHQVLTVASQVWREGIRGPLNVEHGEMLRPETIALLKETKALVHMQPCHWLSDRRWLKEKLGPLYRYAFAWAALQAEDVQYQWGSDSPIEESSVYNNWQALTDSAGDGISPIEGNLLAAHSHPDLSWGPDCQSTFENGQIKELIFDGKKLI
jgi:predicted amidohydrolase YtcJ